MMLGYFPGKIRKGKLKIPKKFRFYFENRAVLITNPDEGCLALEVAGNTSSKEKPIYRTTIIKGTLELPSWLRVISGVYSDEVIVMGLIDKLEIWDKAIWKQMIKSQEDYEAFRFF
jgi:DNA-binding transcriptional regulator/RsmH inhibitor MraZ